MPKINQLPSASSVSATDLFAIDNSSGTATKNVSGQMIKDYVTADVAAEVTDLKNAISEPTYQWLLGRYISNTGVLGNDSKFAVSTKIPCQEGDMIRSVINGTHSGTTLWFVFYNGETFISRVAGSITDGNVVPSGANVLRLSIATSVTMTQEIADDFQFTFYTKDMSYQKLLAASNNLYNFNCVDILEGNLKLINDKVNSSFNIVANGDCSFTFWGTASAGANFNVVSSLNVLPSYIETGKTYYFSNSSNNIYFEIYPMNGSDIIPGTSISVINGKTPITIPSNCNGIIIRFRITAGTYSAETVYVHGFNSLTNKELTESGTGTNNYEFNTYNNTYNVTASPSITTDTNNYLAARNDTTDMTSAIASMLSSTGYCNLGPGMFYVKNLSMPDNTALRGCGTATRIRLIDGDNCSAVILGSNCLLSDIWLVGASEITPTSTVGTRHGILWQGTYTSNQNSPSRSMVSNVKITSFTGGGITCADTGSPVSNYIEVVNAIIHNCGAGINISYSSEFNKFTNVTSQRNYYGCINNGGNNMFVNCDFSSSLGIGFLMDNSSNQSPNNSHGSAIGCVFNHTNNNVGTGIKILNCDNGFIFDGCQIFYSKLHFEDSDGIVVSNCNFGASNCDIEIDGGGAILFNGNMHQSAPTKTITNNSNVHFVNCYVRSTGAIVS